MKNKNLPEQRFINKLNNRNAKSARKILFFVILIEIAMVVFTLFRRGYPNKSALLILYAIMLLFSLGFYSYLTVMTKLSKPYGAHAILLAEFICFFAFCWGAAISFFDMKHGRNGSIVFLTIIFTFTSTFYIRPKRYLAIISISMALFLSAVLIDNVLHFSPGMLINHAVFTAVALIFNHQRYAGLIKEYTREVNYKDINKRLKDLNENQERINESLKKACATDALTGVNNRWSLHSIFDEALNDCKRRRVTLTVMMFDVDNFKKINDTLGHKAGDETLVTIAKIFKNTFPSDSVFRYGGEEFIVLLKNTNSEESSSLAESIRSEVAKQKASSLNLSISGGVYVKVPDANSDSDEYMVNADAALYQAKESGKNRVVIKIV